MVCRNTTTWHATKENLQLYPSMKSGISQCQCLASSNSLPTILPKLSSSGVHPPGASTPTVDNVAWNCNVFDSL